MLMGRSGVFWSLVLKKQLRNGWFSKMGSVLDVLEDPYTITKHGKNKTALKIECGSFSYGFVHMHVVDLQLILQFPTRIFEIIGRLICRWKGIFNIFPTVYHTPKISKNFSCKLQKKMIVRIVGLHKTMAKRTHSKLSAVLFAMFCYSG